MLDIFFCLQTLKFKAIVLVRSLDAKIERQPKESVIASDHSFGDVERGNDDVVSNVLTLDKVLKGREDGIPWRGPKDKCDALLHLLFNGFCPSKGIVADLTAATGTSF